MIASPSVERLEILHPALNSINGGSGPGVPSTSDDHCLGVEVLNGTGVAVIKTIIHGRLITLSMPIYRVQYLRLKLFSWLPSGLIRVTVVKLSLP